MNTPRTFAGFQTAIRLRYQAEGVEFDQYDIDSAASPSQWHEQELLPWALAGETFSKDVCRSIAKHGIHRLDWFARHFQGSVPSDIAISTGLTLSKKGLLQ